MTLQYGDTPLHTAARYGHAGVTRILISAKCAISETNKVYIVHWSAVVACGHGLVSSSDVCVSELHLL